eukprot:scaffold21562_cov101-Isochrysis_galbana.AAC.2
MPGENGKPKPPCRGEKHPWRERTVPPPAVSAIAAPPAVSITPPSPPAPQSESTRRMGLKTARGYRGSGKGV